MFERERASIPSFLLSVAALSVLVSSARAEPTKPLSPSAVTDRLGEVDLQIAEMTQDLRLVQQGYGDPQILAGTGNRVERRLREGEIHFLLSDYLRASIVLLDVVEDPALRSHPRYDECLYFLAESLRRSQQYSGARRYFEDLLPRARGERLKDVILSLLEIASATGRYERVDAYIQQLRSAGALSRPDVDYLHGKMLFQSAGSDPARLNEAYQVFKSVTSGHPVSAQAAYYAGVTKVQQGQYDAAITEFQEALGRAKGMGQSGQLMVDLANLALARLYQELGHLTEAVDRYQDIGRRSPSFQDMLFEVAWAHVKAASQQEDPEGRDQALTRALRTAEMLMATGPDSRMYPEARILEGNLQIRLGAPETAYDTFESIIDRYGGARSKLADLIASNPDPRQFFDQLIVNDIGSSHSTAFIPPLAVDWAHASPGVKRAVAVMADLGQAEAFQKEAEELLEKLESAISGERRYGMFKGLSSSRAKAYSLENRYVMLNQRLLGYERAMLVESLSPSELASLDALSVRRISLENELRDLPQSEAEVEERRADIEKSYQEAEHRVFRQSLQLSSMRAQVIAMEIWLNQNRDMLDGEGRKMMQERLSEVGGQVMELERDLVALQRETRSAATLHGGDAGRGRARQVREDYAEVMREESALLAGFRSRAPSDVQAVAIRMDQQRQALSQMHGELARLQTELDQQIDARIAELRELVREEGSRLEVSRADYRGLRGETDQALGPVASNALAEVAEEFKGLVLKADVGVIDVAWARKQSVTQEVGSLVQEQQLRIRELETEFADVLIEE